LFTGASLAVSRQKKIVHWSVGTFTSVHKPIISPGFVCISVIGCWRAGADGAIGCWRAGADGALIPSCWESGSLFKHREGITEVGG
jgi:hypothetical protein